MEEAGSDELKLPSGPPSVDFAVDDFVYIRMNAPQRCVGQHAWEVRVGFVGLQAPSVDSAIKSQQHVNAPLVAIGIVPPDGPQDVSKTEDQRV